MLYSIFVGHLPNDATREELTDMFSECGDVVDVYIHPEKERPFGYGFVRYANPESVLKAVQEVCEWTLHGKPLKVEIATESRETLRLVLSAKRPTSKGVKRDTAVRSRLKETVHSINKELDLVNGDVPLDSQWVVKCMESMPPQYATKLTGTPVAGTVTTQDNLLRRVAGHFTDDDPAVRWRKKAELRDDLKSLLCDLQDHFSAIVISNREQRKHQGRKPVESEVSDGQPEDEEATVDSSSASDKKMSACLPQNFTRLLDLTLKEGEDGRADSQSVDGGTESGFLGSRVPSPGDGSVDQFLGDRQREAHSCKDQSFELDSDGQRKDQSPASRNHQRNKGNACRQRMNKNSSPQSPQVHSMKQNSPQVCPSASASSRAAVENPAVGCEGLKLGLQCLEPLLKKAGSTQPWELGVAGADTRSVYYQALLLGLRDMKKKNLLPPEIAQKMPDLPGGLPGPGGPVGSKSGIASPLSADANAPGGPFPAEPRRPKASRSSRRFEGHPGSPSVLPGSPQFGRGLRHPVQRQLFNGLCSPQPSAGRGGSASPAWHQEPCKGATAWSPPNSSPVLVPASYNGLLDPREQPLSRSCPLPQRSRHSDLSDASPPASIAPSSGPRTSIPQPFRNGPAHLMRQADDDFTGVVRWQSQFEEKVVCEDWSQTNGQASASNAAGALQGVDDRGFTPRRTSTPERPASFSCRATIPQHKTDISGRASTPTKSTCLPCCASTPQRTTSVSHRMPVSQQEMAFSNHVPAPRQSICPPRCASASQQKTLALGRGRGDFLKALVTSQGKPVASKGPGGSDVSVVMPVRGRGQALQKVLNMKK